VTGDTNKQTPTHVAFSDESYYKVGRYRSIGLVTVAYGRLGKLASELTDILEEARVRELKWQKLDANNDCQAALKFVECAVSNACAANIRIDVLVWDTADSRHRVVGRDDMANLQRMYYHLFKNVLIKRWPDGSIWRLHPDEQSGIDWSEIARFLDAVSIPVSRRIPFSGFAESLRTEFNIGRIEQRKSEAEPLIQMADLFAGMGVYSRDRYEHFRCWLLNCRAERQALLLSEIASSVVLSNADKMRCPVLHKLHSLCKKGRLGVGFDESRGLHTHDPANPINFWLYEPQREEDKAPVRERR